MKINVFMSVELLMYLKNISESASLQKPFRFLIQNNMKINVSMSVELLMDLKSIFKSASVQSPLLDSLSNTYLKPMFSCLSSYSWIGRAFPEVRALRKPFRFLIQIHITITVFTSFEILVDMKSISKSASIQNPFRFLT